MVEDGRADAKLAMRCQRCFGTMGFERSPPRRRGITPWSCETGRCLQCGKIIDFVLLRGDEAASGWGRACNQG